MDRFPHLNRFRAHSQAFYHSLYIPEASVLMYLSVSWNLSSDNCFNKGSWAPKLLRAWLLKGKLFLYSEPFWYQTCRVGFLFLFSYKSIFQLSSHQLGVLQFSYDTNYLEQAQTSQVKSSVLQDCPPLQMSVTSPRLSFVWSINYKLGFPTSMLHLRD